MKCPFCVNQKYDRVFLHSPLEKFYDPTRKKVCLLDDNVFGCPQWKDILEELMALKKPFKFKQLKDEIKEMEKNHFEMQALCHSQQKYIEQLNASIESLQDKIVDLSTRLGLSEAKVNELESEKGESLWHKLKKHINWK